MNFTKIKNIIVNEYPLSEQIAEEVDFYQIDKHRYLLFWNEIIEKNHINEILELVLSKTSNNNFHPFRTIIIVGKTIDTFTKEDLVHCYMNHTGSSKDTTVWVNFYLIDNEKKQIHMEDSWIFPIGLGYRKIIRKLDKIIRLRIVL